MSDIRQRLINRFAIVRADLDEALDHSEGLPLDWAPTHGMRTLGGQLSEILATEIQNQALIEGRKPASYKEVEASVTLPSMGAYRKKLAEVRAKTLQLIADCTDEQLEEEVAVPKGWWEALGFESAPRSEVWRSLAAHEWYHTGQITTYLWIAGRDPYDW